MKRELVVDLITEAVQLFFLFLMFACGMGCGCGAANYSWQAQAIAHGAATYNTDGEFVWLERK